MKNSSNDTYSSDVRSSQSVPIPFCFLRRRTAWPPDSRRPKAEWPSRSYSPSVREVVGTALFNRFLVGRALVQPLGPCVQIRILRPLAKCSRHLTDKTHLDIGAAQCISHEELPTLQSAVDVREVIAISPSIRGINAAAASPSRAA